MVPGILHTTWMVFIWLGLASLLAQVWTSTVCG